MLAALPRSYSNLGQPRVIDTPGLDQESGLYLLRGGVTVTIPLKFEDVAFERAHGLIDSLIGDFNFTNDASRVGAWAAILIAGTRGTLENAPHIGVRTPHAGQGGGKSTLSETYIAVAADGDPVRRTMNLEKDISDTGTMIFRHLLERPEALAVTNIDFDDGREFRSPKLLDLATNGHIDGKLLYSNKAGSMTVRALITLSGNELRLDMHLARRTIMLELLRPDGATPKKIRVPDPNKYVMAHRSEVIAAILTLITAYWDACREEGGRPKMIEHMCRGRASTFSDRGVDFLLDAATFLTGGKWGSAYDAFDTGKKKSASYNNDIEGLNLVEQVMERTGPGQQFARFNQQPVSQQHPATADELWALFLPADRATMGEILNRNRPNPNWSPKSLADWLSARVGVDRGPGIPRLRGGGGGRVGKCFWF